MARIPPADWVCRKREVGVWIGCGFEKKCVRRVMRRPWRIMCIMYSLREPLCQIEFGEDRGSGASPVTPLNMLMDMFVEEQLFVVTR